MNQHKTLIILNLFFGKYGFLKKQKYFGGNIFVYFWCVFYYNHFSNAFIGFVVIFCIYEHVLKIVVHMFGKKSRSVNSYRTNCFFVIVEDIVNKCFLVIVYDLCEKK